MKTLLKVLFIFLAITGATTIMLQYTNIEFGKTDFFEVHGYLFLICISFFPRLTLLFSSVAFGGILWWIAFFITPRFLVAVLATQAYWKTNPFLVTIAWLIAIGGESTEKFAISRGGFFGRKPKMYFKFKSSRPEEQYKAQGNGDVFEAEYKVKE